jgi:hypothetical protein
MCHIVLRDHNVDKGHIELMDYIVHKENNVSNGDSVHKTYRIYNVYNDYKDYTENN